MKILFLGDIFGRPGRRVVETFLPEFKKTNKVDLCIANCENLSNGKGLCERTVSEMLVAGVNIFSSGNHFWDKKISMDYLSKEKRIAKPLNYPKDSIGFDHVITRVNDIPVMLLTVCGQAYMHPVDSPFRVLDNFLNTYADIPGHIIIDFHAESTAEKKTFGYYFDGRVSAILGTHTHIQTADEEILRNGTAYITDVGMCGSHDSVIGITKEVAFERIKTGMPIRHEVATKGMQINGIYFELDDTNGKALNIERIKIGMT